jgi:glycosyltransferase involved in cell wall biosynthesis
MEDKIKVYLQYPWKFPDSPYYKYLIDFPPNDIEYLNAGRQKGVITSKKRFWLSNFLKKSIRKSINASGFSIPNAHLSPVGDYDLIHCCHCLSKNNRPWVADMESYFSLFLSGDSTKRGDKKIERIVNYDNCRKILSWTEATKKEIVGRIPSIEDKIEVVYPAVPVNATPKKKKGTKIKIFYAVRYFWIKGGLIALEVLSELSKRYDLDIVFVGDVPDYLRKKYSNLKIRSMISHKEFLKELASSDIFFYPSLVDTFGFSLLEAMSFGVPPVAISCAGTKSCREIIKDRKTGFVIDAPYYQGNDIYEKCKTIGVNEIKIIENLITKTSQLIENKKLRDKMSKNCLKEISSGKFSIKKRNVRLKKIYKEASK